MRPTATSAGGEADAFDLGGGPDVEGNESYEDSVLRASGDRTQ